MGMRVIIEVAGFARPNRSAAGYGVVVLEEASGELLTEAAEGIGAASVAAAVYRGVCTGLITVASIDASAAIEVRTDCRPVVEQLCGRQDAPDQQMRAAYDEVMQAATSFGPGGVTFAWVPRDRNDHAAQMARHACDEAPWQRPLIRSTSVAAPQPEPESHHPTRAPTDVSAPPMPATTLLLVRTAETHTSLQRRFAGTTDTQLTEAGVAQAEALATHLFLRSDIDVIASSPALPAAQMAAIAGQVMGLAPLMVAGLAEPDYGDWEGLTFAEAHAGWPSELAAWLDDPYTTAPPGGETLNHAQARIHHAINTLTHRFPHRTICVITHPTPIKLLARHALQAAPVAVHRMHLDAAGLTEIDTYPDACLIRCLNDTGHLPTAPTPIAPPDTTDPPTIRRAHTLMTGDTAAG